MTDREKLIELLEAIPHPQRLYPDLFVESLIANGVTVQGWIPVTERLPEFTEEEMERYRFFGDTFFPEFNVMILGATQATTLYFDGERWYDEEGRCYCVTHWQPMPQPPKGE